MKLIIIEDNPDHQLLISRKLKDHFRDNITIDSVSTIEVAAPLLKKNIYNVILLDYRLGNENGMDLVRWLREKKIDTPVIIITSVEDVGIAVEALKQGASDFLCKGNEGFEKLPHQVEKVIQDYNLKKRLRETEFKYRTIMDTINEAVFMVDQNVRVKYVSSSVEKLFGYSEAEFKEKFLNIFPPDERERFLFHMKIVHKGRSVDPFVVKAVRKNGEGIIVEVNASPLVENENIHGIVGTFQDVTKREMLKKEIETEKMKVENILSSMLDWIIIVDSDYNVQFINRLLAKEVGEPTGKKCYQFLFGKKEPCDFCKLEQVKAGFTVRWELRREDGRTFDIISSPFREPGGKLLSIIIQRNITRRKKAEENYRLKSEETQKANEELRSTIDQLKRTQEQLVQSEKLAAIGKLVSGVAHELNNPLFSAMGYAELMLMGPQEEENRGRLNMVLESIKRARRIVNDLLEFSCPRKVEINRININDVIRQTVYLNNYEFEANNIRVEYDLKDDLPEVRGNFGRLQQVFLNIIINAEQAIQEIREHGGAIRIKSMVDESGFVFVTIANNGSRIPEENIGKIFDPFFTTKEVGMGTGLGLSTSYGIIKEHHGEILVRSDEDWTSFTVKLPTVHGSETTFQPEKEKLEDVSAKGEPILVVDDEQVIVNLLEDFLKRKGFRVFTATSGSEAVLQLKNREIQMIISDIKMPGISGKMFYNEIKKHRPELLKRLIFITGDTMGKDTIKFLKETGGYYLRKPFSFDEMVEMIQKVSSPDPQGKLFI